MCVVRNNLLLTINNNEAKYNIVVKIDINNMEIYYIILLIIEVYMSKGNFKRTRRNIPRNLNIAGKRIDHVYR